MIGWIIAVTALATLCIALIVAYERLKGKIQQQTEDTAERDSLRAEIRRLRMDDVRRRRELTAMDRELDAQQLQYDELSAEFTHLRQQAEAAEHRAQMAERRRIATEKDLSASQMKLRLLETQYEELKGNQLAQEQLYQDILREKEELIERLQEAPKRRPRKKTDVIADQITLNDLLSE